MEEAKTRARRRHDGALKREVLAQCAAAGASVAQVAMAHGLNANLIHKWRRDARTGGLPPVAATFVPVVLDAERAPEAPATRIDVELRRGALSVRVRWPVDAGAACASWLREILR
jgi:transposase